MPTPLKHLLWTILLAGGLLLSSHPLAQAMTIDAEQQLTFADSLFNDQQYLRAAEEFQRFTFFFPDHPKNRTARFKAADAFMLAKEIDTALGIFQKISAEEPLDAMASEAFFKMADGYLQLNAPTHAVVQLNNIIALSDDTTLRDRAYYHIGWINIELTDWDGAKSAFARISPEGRLRHGADQLNLALSDAGAIATKSPSLSGTLSIIPGAGQLYCQRYEDAVIAFALNIGLFWAAHDAFDNDQYGLGGLLSFVGLGFYVGNIYGAVNDAHKYNQGQTRQFIDQLKQYQVIAEGPPSDVNAIAKKGFILGLKIPF